jgi:LysM repeat protein
MLRKLSTLLLILTLTAPLVGRAAAPEPPKNAYVAGVIGHAQSYVLSCEARSAVDWAAFWGVAIGEWAFYAGLPHSDNPDQGFVGYVNDAWGLTPPNGYGVHAKPVAARLRAYGLDATALSGLSWRDLRNEVAAGRPVIVWIIGQMWPGTPQIYVAADGTRAVVAPFEHTMILVGYTETQVFAVDAYSGNTLAYTLDAFLASWQVLGNMAVLGNGPTQPPTGGATGKGTYTVQSGDTLSSVAERFETTWTELAEMNGLVYPYIIYPGQVLTVPVRVQATATARPPAATPVPTQALLLPAYAPYRQYVPLLQQARRALAQPTATRAAPTATPTAPRPTVRPSATPAGPATYTVQPGDYLKGIAEKFGLDWQTLARLNGLSDPYVIYPGQVLKLR